MNMGWLKAIGIAFLLLTAGACKEDEKQAPGTIYHIRSIRNEFPGLAGVSGSMSFQNLQLNSGVRHLSPAFTLLYDDHLQIPGFASSLCNSLMEASQDPGALLYYSFRMLGAPAGGFGPPLAGTGGREVRPLEFSFYDEGKESWNLLHEELRKGIIELLQGWVDAEAVLMEFLAPLGNNQSLERLMEPWINRELKNFASMDLIEKADLRKLSFASRLMASSLNSLLSLKLHGSAEGFKHCVLHTPVGKVGIFGAQKDTIESGYALIIDLGGDDLYKGHIASPSAGRMPIAVVVDFQGNDTYKTGDGYLVNGCQGIGMLFDLAGDDRYVSEKAGIASSCYGTSLLYDRTGDDLYQSSAAFCQGAAHVGIALLIDREGDDQYSSSGSSQGYGGTLGFGLLMDLAGSDSYNYGQGTTSFVQGAGRGRWAESTDGHSLGGGLGMFIEAGGADRYYAESFSQGASYFTGMGLFFDLAGDDHYNALSHSQGYAAHFALSGFFELRGDDHYNAGSDFNQITQVLGSGRDLSAGWFIEEQGDDTYHFGNRSCGIGDLDGEGILWDRSGHDTFIWHQNEVNAGSPSMGRVTGLPGGMGIGMRPGSYTEGQKTGQFRVDGKRKLMMR
jgi:hypothetical protein